MKKVIITLIVLFSFALNGCDSKDARSYATELIGILKSYKVEINKKIKTEQESYKDLAGTYAYAKQMNVQLGLQTERLRRASQLTDKLLSEKNDGEITTSDVGNMILDYANSDFDKTRQMLERESDDQAEFLTGLESLELQAQNIDALIKVLEGLEKPDSDLKKLKDLAKFAQEFKKKLNQLECEDLQRKIACLKQKFEEIKGQKDKEVVRKNGENNPKTKETIQIEIDRLQAEMDGVQTEIDRIGSQVKENGCEDKAFECPDKP
jgi:hypothetical protein